jgi:hypothetical protein
MNWMAKHEPNWFRQVPNTPVLWQCSKGTKSSYKLHLIMHIYFSYTYVKFYSYSQKDLLCQKLASAKLFWKSIGSHFLKKCQNSKFFIIGPFYEISLKPLLDDNKDYDLEYFE